MNILKIFGAVVVLHLVVFIIIFASPGCQSTPRRVPTPDATAPTAAPPSATFSPRPGDVVPTDLTVPAGSSLPATTFNPALPAGRAVPTRPGSPTAVAVVPPKPVVEDVAPVSTYTVVRGDSLWTIAKRHGLTVSDLAKANNLSTGAALQPGKKLIVPGRAGAVAAAAAATSDHAVSGEGTTYKVASGDSLASIAKKYGTTVAALKATNSLSSDIVRPGQELRLPAGSRPAAERAETAPAAPRANGEAVVHVVQSGEKLANIARKYQVSVGELAAANAITDPAKIRAGQKLTIPGFKAVSGAKGAPAGEPAAAPSAAPPAPGGGLKFEIKPPPPGQDLDAGLKDPGTAVPTIKIEETKPVVVPPKGS
jgi:LysM repeat protein